MVFYGVGNAHMQMLKALYPKLRIVARGNVLRIIGDEEQMTAFERAAEQMQAHIVQFNSLSEEDIIDIVKGRRTRDEVPEGVVCYTTSGRPIKARSENQQRLVDEFLEVLHADFFTQNLTNLLSLVVTCGFARANRFFGNECEECQCNRAYEHRTPTSDFSNCCHFFSLFFIDFLIIVFKKRTKLRKKYELAEFFG